MTGRRRLLLGLLVVFAGAGLVLTLVAEETGQSVPCAPGASACPLGEAVADLERFWSGTPAPQVRLAIGRVVTECGPNTADEGSFYCGEERRIYLQREDLDGFASELDDAVARAAGVYLLAHEWAHALQDARGVDPGDERTGPASSTVRYELQADCLAGVFVASLRGADREAYVEAVRVGGDDVGPDPLAPQAFAHGSGEQRLRWFTRGWEARADTACDTFTPARP